MPTREEMYQRYLSETRYSRPRRPEPTLEPVPEPVGPTQGALGDLAYGAGPQVMGVLQALAGYMPVGMATTWLRRQMGMPERATPAEIQEDTAEMLGLEAPTTRGGRVLANVGTGGVMAVPFAAAAPSAALGALEMGLGVGVPAFADVVERMMPGEPAEDPNPWVETGVGLATIPIGGVATAGRGISRLARQGDEAAEAAARAVDYLADQGVGGLSAVHRAPDISDAYEAAVDVKAQLAKGVKEPEKYVERVRGKVGRAKEDFQSFYPGEEPIYPLPSQVAAQEGGFNLQANILRRAKAHPEEASDILGRRFDVMEDVENFYETMRPMGSYEASRAALTSTITDRLRDVRARWADAPMVDDAIVDITDLQMAALEMSERAPTKAYLPREVQTILDAPTMVSPRWLQDLESELKLAQRAPRTAYTAWRRGRGAGPLVGEAEEALEGALNASEMQSLRDARAGTREFWREFDPSRPAFKALQENAEPRELLKAIRRSKDVVAEAASVREWMGGSHEAQLGISEAVFEDIFGETIGDTTMRHIKKRLGNRRDRAIYEQLLSPEELEFADRMARQWEIATQGMSGTIAQARATGTGYGDFMDTLQKIQGSNAPLTARVADFFSNMIARAGEVSPQHAAILRAAEQDLELYSRLLDIPTPPRGSTMHRVWVRALEETDRRIAAVARAGTVGARSQIRRATQEDIERLQRQGR